MIYCESSAFENTCKRATALNVTYVTSRDDFRSACNSCSQRSEISWSIYGSVDPLIKHSVSSFDNMSTWLYNYTEQAMAELQLVYVHACWINPDQNVYRYTSDVQPVDGSANSLELSLQWNYVHGIYRHGFPRRRRNAPLQQSVLPGHSGSCDTPCSKTNLLGLPRRRFGLCSSGPVRFLATTIVVCTRHFRFLSRCITGDMRTDVVTCTRICQRFWG